jgi:hypothetical protein
MLAVCALLTAWVVTLEDCLSNCLHWHSKTNAIMSVNSSLSYVCSEMCKLYVMTKKEALFRDPFLKYFFFTVPLNGTERSTHTAQSGVCQLYDLCFQRSAVYRNLSIQAADRKVTWWYILRNVQLCLRQRIVYSHFLSYGKTLGCEATCVTRALSKI